VKTFEGKGFSVTQKISEKKENTIYFAWFSSINYLGGEGKLIVELGQNLKKLLLSAKKTCFYQIKYPINFTNIYSKRIYYYLKSFENTGWRVDNLDILRAKLECPKSYNRFADFRKHVLTPAFEEINGDSDISFEYMELKTKRKVTGIKFYIKSSKLNTKAIDEVCATTDSKCTNEEEKCVTELISEVKTIFKENITGLEAKFILNNAKNNIHIIKQKYALSQNINKIDNIVGWIIKAIKEDYQSPKGKEKGGSFNDYEQRSYDFDDLEKKLLG
jgi:plasmid replication initiation protein